MAFRTRLASSCAGALLAAASLAGCGSTPGSQPPANGVLTLDVTPAAVSVANLQLTSAHVSIENLTLIGDVAPDQRSMLSDFDLDLLSTGRSFTFDMLPQGLYSRVTLKLEEIHVQGSWRGVPLEIQIEQDNGATVDLRSSAGVDLTAGKSASFTITVDAGSWFAGQLLDSATQSSSQIVVNGASNAPIGAQLISRAVASFALHDAPIP